MFIRYEVSKYTFSCSVASQFWGTETSSQFFSYQFTELQVVLMLFYRQYPDILAIFSMKKKNIFALLLQKQKSKS